MRIILYIIRKEFLQIFRNKAMLPIIFVTPLIQLLILSNAATYEIKDTAFDVVDFDQSPYSREFLSKFTASEYFTYKKSYFSVEKAEIDFQTSNAKLIIVIPKDFEKNYILNGSGEIQFIIDAENGNAAQVIYNYCLNITKEFNSSIILDWVGIKEMVKQSEIEVSYLNWFNPLLNYKTYMVPGILVVLVTIIGMFLAGMNIAKEKEMGTIEQLNVTPIKKYQFITGKLFPFWIIAMVELGIGVLIAIFVFDVPMLGSIFTIYIIGAIYMFAVLGIGLLISTNTDTQQQAMFIAWFFMVIFLMMGGIFTPIESMPQWAQTVDYLNPLSYFNRSIRMIMLKGSGLADIANSIYVLAAYAVVILSLAVWRYKKVN